jgi:succinoglycan biosynthesis protein ExoV
VKLHYFKDPNGNFGDDLNEWIWPTLVPELLNDDESELLVGIGTLLNRKLPANPIKHVIGSGLGYGQPPVPDRTFQFHAVRGYRTAKVLGLPDSTVITDSAILVRQMKLPPPAGGPCRAGVMMTGHTLHQFDWQPICEAAGLNFISCHWPVSRVLSEMQRCDLIIAEAMHGAIVADALRIPWIPIVCSDLVLEFKWQDWLSSLDLTYEPMRLPALHGSTSPPEGFGASLKQSVKRVSSRMGIWPSSWGERPRRHSSRSDVASAVIALKSIADARPRLSGNSVILERANRFESLIDTLRSNPILIASNGVRSIPNRGIDCRAY